MLKRQAEMRYKHGVNFAPMIYITDANMIIASLTNIIPAVNLAEE
jgi:hypothetical protein